MSQSFKRLSGLEMSQRILEMAKTGVYRESILEAFRPFATQKQISGAIAQAKQFGLYSVASLRDPELGTYYQMDAERYESLQKALTASVTFQDDENLVDRITETAKAMRLMLVISGGLAIALLGIGAICLTSHQAQWGFEAWAGALTAASIWLLQKALTQKVL